MVDRSDSHARWVAEVSAAYRQHATRLHRNLLGKLGNEQDARDAVQEVFLRFSRVKNADLVDDPIKYLYGIARKVVWEIRQRRGRELIDFDSELTEHHSEHPSGYSVDRPGDAIEDQQLLARAFERLRPIEREILNLIKRQGMSHKQVAQALNLSPHTVKKYAAQAMAQLKFDWTSNRFGAKKP